MAVALLEGCRNPRARRRHREMADIPAAWTQMADTSSPAALPGALLAQTRKQRPFPPERRYDAGGSGAFRDRPRRRASACSEVSPAQPTPSTRLGRECRIFCRRVADAASADGTTARPVSATGRRRRRLRCRPLRRRTASRIRDDAHLLVLVLVLVLPRSPRKTPTRRLERSTSMSPARMMCSRLSWSRPP